MPKKNEMAAPVSQGWDILTMLVAINALWLFLVLEGIMVAIPASRPIGIVLLCGTVLYAAFKVYWNYHEHVADLFDGLHFFK